MAMGIVSNDEFEKDTINSGSIKPVIPAVVIDSPDKGRGVGSVEVPNSLRKIIGETSIIDGRASAVKMADKFGISPSSVSAYKEGATSTATIKDKPNKAFLDKSKMRMSKRALSMMTRALDHITDDKLVDCKPGELGVLARNMSSIVKDMTPEEQTDNKTTISPQFHIYSPGFRKEESFETIYVKE